MFVEIGVSSVSYGEFIVQDASDVVRQCIPFCWTKDTKSMGCKCFLTSSWHFW